MKLYLVAYDISSNKRRKKIAEKLENYGTRINLSVFECTFTPAQLTEIRRFIKKNINKRKDIVKIYYLSRKCYAKSFTLGQKIAPPDGTFYL